MKRKLFIITIMVCAIFLAAGTVWGIKGGIPANDKKPPEDPTDPPATPIDGYYFWKLGHMDGPHTASKAFGISRDGKTAVGENVVVDFTRAWRVDIDWALSTEEDGIPPLYNELQVMEDLGVVAPSQPSAAFASSDMIDANGEPIDCSHYDKVNLVLDFCGSMPVGTFDIGQVSYGIEWMEPVLDQDPIDITTYHAIPDFGGGIADMSINDVSSDGVFLVGTGNTKTGPKAFFADTTVVDEEGVPIPVQLTIQDAVTEQTLRSSSAQALASNANDEAVIAGFGSTKTAMRAFVTTVVNPAADPITDGLVSSILPILGGGKFAEAYAITPDGAVIAGRSDSPKGPVACIWFPGDDPATSEVETWLIREIGALSKKSKDAAALGIAYRPGSTAGELIVVGRSKTILYPSEAFVWTGNPVLEPDGPYTLPDGTVNDYIGYFYDLEKVLTKTGAGEASLMGSSWILYEATGISSAGDRIVGWGINPEGGIEAWLVTNFPYDDLVFTHE